MEQNNWEAVIGLEVHAQLKTRTKLFCRCATQFGGDANSNVCPVCLGYPGALPVLNAEAVRMAVCVGLALNSTVNTMSYFERKNYFYPDLPKAYQISQLAHPICSGGKLCIELRDQHGAVTAERAVGIERIQLEEDAGKLMHSEDASVRESYVDLNRTSTPLIEIVSAPELRSAAEAVEYMRSLRTLLLYLAVCDGNMQEGSLRCDANVSIRQRGASALGTRTEIKNMNTFKGVAAAINYEIKRQIGVLERGAAVTQDTMLFDNVLKQTRVMRSKGEARDYRYFPDPDLLPVMVSAENIAALKTALPELPAAKRKRFMRDYGLSAYDSALLTETKALAAYYERALGAAPSGAAKRVANWLTTEVLSVLNEKSITIEAFKIPAEAIGRLVALVEGGTLSGKLAKTTFKEMLSTGEAPDAIVKKQGYQVVADQTKLSQLISKVLSEHPAAAAAYRAGKQQSFGFLVGQVMRATRGQAQPQLVNTLLKQALTAQPTDKE